jgi:hypothetical protein
MSSEIVIRDGFVFEIIPLNPVEDDESRRRLSDFMTALSGLSVSETTPEIRIMIHMIRAALGMSLQNDQEFYLFQGCLGERDLGSFFAARDRCRGFLVVLRDRSGWLAAMTVWPDARFVFRDKTVREAQDHALLVFHPRLKETGTVGAGLHSLAAIVFDRPFVICGYLDIGGLDLGALNEVPRQEFRAFRADPCRNFQIEYAVRNDSKMKAVWLSLLPRQQRQNDSEMKAITARLLQRRQQKKQQRVLKLQEMQKKITERRDFRNTDGVEWLAVPVQSSEMERFREILGTLSVLPWEKKSLDLIRKIMTATTGRLFVALYRERWLACLVARESTGLKIQCQTPVLFNPMTDPRKHDLDPHEIELRLSSFAALGASKSTQHIVVPDEVSGALLCNNLRYPKRNGFFIVPARDEAFLSLWTRHDIRL